MVATGSSYRNLGAKFIYEHCCKKCQTTEGFDIKYPDEKIHFEFEEIEERWA